MEWMVYIEKGGVIMEILIALNVIGWTIMGWSFFRLLFVRAKKSRLLAMLIEVLMAFDAISKTGMGDPGVFAGGISLALVTTIGGLVVAIPHYIGYNYLVGMIDALEVEIEKEILPALYHDEKLVAKRNG